MQQYFGKSPESSPNDHTKLFLITTSKVYFAKAKLYDYLPLMLSRATNQNLKTIVSDITFSVSSQLSGLNFILEQLKQILIVHTPVMHQMEDLDEYLESELAGISNYSTDVLLLGHLNTIESNEIEALRLLQMLALKFYNKTTFEDISRYLQGALNTKKALDQLLDFYVM